MTSGCCRMIVAFLAGAIASAASAQTYPYRVRINSLNQGNRVLRETALAVITPATVVLTVEAQAA